MTVAESIINHAFTQSGVLQRKELIEYVRGVMPEVSSAYIDLQLNRIIASGLIVRDGRGWYSLSEHCKPEFMYSPSDDEKKLFLELKRRFPFLEICVWSPKVLSPLMLHVPNVGYRFVDVEKDGIEAVFHSLQEMDLDCRLLLDPSTTECELYLMGTDAIVVRRLVSQSPTAEMDGCVVPTIEKILVDALGDKELLFAGGTEIYNIYKNANERYKVNFRRLKRYASRRNRQAKVEKILNVINNDKSEK